MYSIHNDINSILGKIKSINNSIAKRYIDMNSHFFYANFNEYKDTEKIGHLTQSQILIQKITNIEIMKVLEKIDEYAMPVVGLKGIFLEHYYNVKNVRFFSDLDLFVLPKYSYDFSKKLMDCGYQLKKDIYPLNNNLVLFKMLKSNYSKNIHSLEFVKSIQVNSRMIYVPIELHCNLNVSSECQLNNEVMFYSSKPFGSFKNIKYLDEYENVLFLIYHISKHLSFSSPYAVGFHINIQMLVDVFYVISKIYDFNEHHLIQKAQTYNLIPQVILFEFLFNGIFITSDFKFNLEEHILLLKKCNCKWKGFLLKLLETDPVKILIGDYSDVYEDFNQLYEKLYHTKNQNIRALKIRKYVTKQNE